MNSGRFTRFLTLHLLLICVMLLLPGALCVADDWTGWRGEAQEGHSRQANGPLHWNARRNIRWQTPIPGLGHSSPIVHGDTVYLTTAEYVKQDKLFGQFIVGGAVVFVLLLQGLSFGILYSRVARRQKERGSIPRLFGHSMLFFLLLVLGYLVLFGDSALAYDRDLARAWMGVVVPAALALAIPGILAVRAWGRVAAGASLEGLAVLAWQMIPNRSQAIPGGVFDLPGAFYALILALPVLLGGWLLLTALAEGKTGIPDYDAPPRGQRWWTYLPLAALAAVFLAVCIIAALHAQEIVVANGAFRYFPMKTPWWVGLIAPVFLGIYTAWHGWRVRHPLGYLLLALWAGTTLFFLGVFFFHVAAAHSRFLMYIWGGWFIGKSIGMVGKPLKWLFPLALLAAWGVALLVGWLSARAAKPAASRRWEGLPTLISLLAAFGLIGFYGYYVLYLPQGPFYDYQIVAVNRQDGAVKWICHGLRNRNRGRLHADNSHATPTPVTDGRYIYAYYGDAGAFCAGTGGRLIWTNTRLPFSTRMGTASSPALWQGRLIILSESDLGKFLIALDCRTGIPVWTTKRTHTIHSFAGNCRTPVVMSLDGRDVIVVWGFEDLSGYDPQTGKELWSYQVGRFGTETNPVITLVSDKDGLYLIGRRDCMKIARGRLGLPGSPIVWHKLYSSIVECSSPVLDNGLLYAVSDFGPVYCIDAATGEIVWRRRLPGNYYASPIVIGDRVYFTNRRGLTTVIKSGREFRMLATNPLKEKVHASLAPVDGEIFLRSFERLICIK